MRYRSCNYAKLCSKVGSAPESILEIHSSKTSASAIVSSIAIFFTGSSITTIHH